MSILSSSDYHSRLFSNSYFSHNGIYVSKVGSSIIYLEHVGCYGFPSCEWKASCEKALASLSSLKATEGSSSSL